MEASIPSEVGERALENCLLVRSLSIEDHPILWSHPHSPELLMVTGLEREQRPAENVPVNPRLEIR